MLNISKGPFHKFIRELCKNSNYVRNPTFRIYILLSLQIFLCYYLLSALMVLWKDFAVLSQPISPRMLKTLYILIARVCMFFMWSETELSLWRNFWKLLVLPSYIKIRNFSCSLCILLLSVQLWHIHTNVV